MLRDENGKFKKGNKGFWLGKKRDAKTKNKISDNLKGKFCRDKHPKWKGGRFKTKYGYIEVLVEWHPRVKNKKRKYLMEHILILEKKIGRYLKNNEHCHHINGIKYDNRPENLQLLSSSHHAILHQQELNHNLKLIKNNILKDEYINSKYSINSLSRKYKVSCWTIRNRLDKIGARIRSKKEQRIYSCGVN